MDGHSLQAALDAWRADRSCVYLANCVDDAAAGVSRLEVPRRMQRWWTDQARTYDPVIATTLLETVRLHAENDDVSWRIVLMRDTPLVPVLRAHGITNDSPRGQWMNLVDRISLLLAWPDDPRVALALAKMLWVDPVYDTRFLMMRRRMEPTGMWGAIATAMIERIVAIGDLRALTKSVAPHLRSWLPRIAEAALAAPRPIARGDGIDAAWEAVIDEPDNLAARLVLADAYMERSDPRGDFIASQVKPLIAIEEARARGEDFDASALFGRDAERNAKLVDANWYRWLDEAALLVSPDSTFRGGVLAQVRVGLAATPPWAWEDCASHRELRVIGHLSASPETAPESFVALLHAVPRKPRWVTLDREMLDVIGGQRMALRGVHLALVRRPVVGQLVRDAIALGPERIGLWLGNEELPIVRRVIYEHPATEFHLSLAGPLHDDAISELRNLPNVHSVKMT